MRKSINKFHLQKPPRMDIKKNKIKSAVNKFSLQFFFSLHKNNNDAPKDNFNRKLT